MEWLPFILALIADRKAAVVVAGASDLSFVETLLLTASWFLALTGLVVFFLDRPWIAHRLAKLRDVPLFKWLLDKVPRILRPAVVFVVCVAPAGLWWGILLVTLWKYRWYQRILLAAAGSTASYFAYEWAMTPLLEPLGPYAWFAIPPMLLAGLAVKERDRLTTVRHWSIRRYRLLVAKATS